MKYQIFALGFIVILFAGLPMALLTQSSDNLSIVSAATDSGGGLGSGSVTSGGGLGSGSVTSGGGPGSGSITNPLGAGTIAEFLTQIIDIILVFALPIIVLFIIYAGFLYVTAQGNEEQLKKAKTALVWSIVGGVVVLGAHVLIGVIQGTVDAVK